MSYSKGIFWLDDCRIPFVNGLENEYSESYLKSGHGKAGNDLQKISGNKREGVYVDNKGRFTPNLLVCDDMLNDGNKGTNSRYYNLDLWFNKMIEKL